MVTTFLCRGQPSYLTGKNMIGTLLRFRNTAVYLRPRCHCPVQCIEMKRETRKEIVQGLRCDLPGPVDNREDETLLGGEGTAQFRGPVPRPSLVEDPSPESRALAGIPNPKPGAPPARTLWAKWRHGAGRRMEGGPAPPQSLVSLHPTCARAPRPTRKGGSPRRVGFPASSLHRRRPIIRRR